jgi:hypothetical protein
MQLLYSPKGVEPWQTVGEVGETPTKELLQHLIYARLGYLNISNKKIEHIISNMADQLLRYHSGFIAGPVHFTDDYFTLVDGSAVPDDLGPARCNTCWFIHESVYCQKLDYKHLWGYKWEHKWESEYISFCRCYVPDFEYRLHTQEEVDDYWENFKDDEETIRGLKGEINNEA